MANDGKKGRNHRHVDGRRPLNQGDCGYELPSLHGEPPLERIGGKDGVAPFFSQHPQGVRSPDVSTARRPQIDSATPARDESARKRSDQIGQDCGGKEGKHG